MKNKLLIPCMLVTLFAIQCCKKYEENPLINLRTREQRLTGNKSYNTVGYWVNGVDSLAAITQKDGITFHIEDGAKVIGNEFIRGTWAWIDHKEYLNIHMVNDSTYHWGYGPFVTFKSSNWTITKLTDRELHIQMDYNGKQYIVHLSKDKF